MKITLSIKKELQLDPEKAEEKILKYLQKKSYKIIKDAAGSISFIDDENDNRKRYRSDFHTRIGEGRFEIQPGSQCTTVKLIYYTPILFPILMMLGFIVIGIYAQSFAALLGIFMFLPVLFKIASMNENVFKEILEC
ncbi:hypothetical protein [Pedobacter nutrimenti]|uniref:hypothetical protein n=1 Tax=Pedobacter nutrimenti TaxID=1241337 RepID=UPI00292EA455|nr:hypothetical protein [Pedobacter nutrimenti]